LSCPASPLNDSERVLRDQRVVKDHAIPPRAVVDGVSHHDIGEDKLGRQDWVCGDGRQRRAGHSEDLPSGVVDALACGADASIDITMLRGLLQNALPM